MEELIDKEAIDKLLEGFNKFTFEEEKHPTFLAIIKQSNREIVWSNILAFFFDPNKDHKLGDLMIKSLIEASGQTIEIKNFKSVTVKTEVLTDNRKRLDIVIEGEGFVIGIENKVEHWLNNDLEDYGKMIARISKNRRVHKIVLSKYNCCEDHFQNVTYDSFIRQIKNNLPNYKINAHKDYLTFLNDFIRNIKTSINFKAMIEKREVLEYFCKNYDQFSVLSSKFVQFHNEFTEKFRMIYDAIDLKDLDTAFKIRFGNEAIIYKDVCSDPNENDRFSTYVINVKNNKLVQYIIYILDDFGIYCYAESNDEPYRTQFTESNDFRIEIEIDENIKVAANRIINQIRKISENVFVE